jgi:hypothetical protein
MKEFTSDFKPKRLPSGRVKRRVIVLCICTALTLVVISAGFAVAIALTAVLGGLKELAAAMSTMLLVLTIPVLIAIALLVSNADWLTWFGLLRQLLKMLELLGLV